MTQTQADTHSAEMFESPSIDPEHSAYVKGKRDGMSAMLAAVKTNKEKSTVSTQTTPPDGFPRWAIGVGGSLLAAGILTSIGFAMQMNAQLAGLAVRVEGLALDVAELKTSIVDGTRQRYTSEDASRDRDSVTAEIRTLRDEAAKREERIRSLELWRAGFGEKPQ